MNTTVLERGATAAKSPAKQGAIDCDIHPATKSPADLKPYMTERWWQHTTTYGSGVRQAFSQMLEYPRMQAEVSRNDAWPPGGGPPGSDLDFMREQHLDANNVETGILIPLRMQAGSQRNHGFGAALCSAINDWQANDWCAKEPRLRASIQISADDAEWSVSEIEKRAGDPAFVQILTAPRNTEPLGRKRYWPIFEAAVAANRPLAMHVGGVSGHPPGAGTGWISYYIEEHQSLVQAMQNVVVSLVTEGVFERFPGLKVVMVEAGFAWAPALAWRLDKQWKRLRSEVPHLKRLPSEYIRDHVWFTTQPIEEPERPDDLKRIMEWIGYDRIMFSTDYPHWDFDDPRHVFQMKLAEADKQSIFRGNARALFNLG